MSRITGQITGYLRNRTALLVHGAGNLMAHGINLSHGGRHLLQVFGAAVEFAVRFFPPPPSRLAVMAFTASVEPFCKRSIMR